MGYGVNPQIWNLINKGKYVGEVEGYSGLLGGQCVENDTWSRKLMN